MAERRGDEVGRRRAPRLRRPRAQRRAQLLRVRRHRDADVLGGRDQPGGHVALRSGQRRAEARHDGSAGRRAGRRALAIPRLVQAKELLDLGAQVQQLGVRAIVARVGLAEAGVHALEQLLVLVGPLAAHLRDVELLLLVGLLQLLAEPFLAKLLLLQGVLLQLHEALRHLLVHILQQVVLQRRQDAHRVLRPRLELEEAPSLIALLDPDGGDLAGELDCVLVRALGHLQNHRRDGLLGHPRKPVVLVRLLHRLEELRPAPIREALVEHRQHHGEALQVPAVLASRYDVELRAAVLRVRLPHVAKRLGNRSRNLIEVEFVRAV
mmetsp:Transcript_33560/g.79201  ORF Transcript_33560/g.79201 Transcript_33560/m.79201 type:complete len:323 (-) Transcript_33560:33-1001(-)